MPDQKFDIQSYSGTDPGIKFNIYGGATSYKIPGPALWSAAASGGGAASSAAPAAPTSAAGGAASTSAAAAAPTTLATSTKAGGGAAPTAPATGGAAMFAQCGGSGFTGATSCAEGTCKKQNDYYSQCVPN